MAFVFTFAVVALTIVLMRSLNKHLRTVRTHPPVSDGSGDAATHTTADSRAEDSNSGGDVVAEESHDR